MLIYTMSCKTHAKKLNIILSCQNTLYHFIIHYIIPKYTILFQNWTEMNKKTERHSTNLNREKMKKLWERKWITYKREKEEVNYERENAKVIKERS